MWVKMKIFSRRKSLSRLSLILITLAIVLVSAIVCSAYGVTTASGSYNPYDVLGIKRSASPQEIRKAYKQLVVLWHPDKNKEVEAEDKFVMIKSAYEVNMKEDYHKWFDH